MQINPLKPQLTPAMTTKTVSSNFMNPAYLRNSWTRNPRNAISWKKNLQPNPPIFPRGSQTGRKPSDNARILRIWYGKTENCFDRFNWRRKRKKSRFLPEENEKNRDFLKNTWKWWWWSFEKKSCRIARTCGEHEMKIYVSFRPELLHFEGDGEPVEPVKGPAFTGQRHNPP